MTGDEHYQRAEQVLGGRVGHLAAFNCKSTAEAIALAQVHATLAVAAATVDAAYVGTAPMYPNPVARYDEGYGR